MRYSVISLLAIVLLATWLRTFNLNSQGILYGDAAHDLWSAQQAVENKELPLLGIESSLPRFRQGPITVWLNIVLFILFGYNLFPYALIYSFTSILAVIFIFFLVKKELGEKAGLVASFVLAVSPLAIAHARVPFIITPLPLILILWLWLVLRLKQKTWQSVFWACFGWGFLFQFELAVMPLLAITIFEVWRTHKKITKEIFAATIGGLVLGLSPQLLYDITHKGEHLGGFLAWVGYRLTTAFIPTTDHALGITKVSTAFNAIFHYSSKIFTVVPTHPISLIFLCLTVIALVVTLKNIKTAPDLVRISSISLTTLLLAFVIHGSPSEAYFPPFLILVPILLGSLYYFLSYLKINPRVFAAISALLLLAVGTHAVVAIPKTNFFTDISQPFSYGPSTGEQRQAIQLIATHISSSPSLKTTHLAGGFPAYFDNLKWLAAENGIQISQNGDQTVWIEQHDSALTTYPHAYIIPLPSMKLVVLIWTP